MIPLGRDICGDLQIASQREWLVTNGIGGYACGTVAGALTRCYHGLLVAALAPPTGRTLLAAKFDELARYAGRRYPLSTNFWQHGGVDPEGFRYVERFTLEGATPVWNYACADALLEKRIWMQPGRNTTYVQYRLARASAPLDLHIKALVNTRDHHEVSPGDWEMEVEEMPDGLRLVAPGGATPFYIRSQGVRSQGVRIEPRHVWFRDYALKKDQYRGSEGIENHLHAADIQASLDPGQALTLVISTEERANLDGESAYRERQDYERDLLRRAHQAWGDLSDPAQICLSSLSALDQLALAADQFIIQRASAEEQTPDLEEEPARADSSGTENPETGSTAIGKSVIGKSRIGQSVIAGYPWFNDWGRDTMISLPGLTLATGRPEIAGRILRTYARFVDQGMLPNRFPNHGESPQYNTADATLWYFEAIRAYYVATGDDKLLAELYPVLEEIFALHLRGTRYHIHADPADGLLYAGEPGMQLTWMDVKIGDFVVTPRTGKPVEVNALWYNALRCMVDFANLLGKNSEKYTRLAEKVGASFERFWYPEGGHLYDVIDGPDGGDTRLRPNQLLAVSLNHSPISPARAKAVVDICARYLLTSHGLRSLGPRETDYVGWYGGDLPQRDRAYHQGAVWGWLIGPFASAHLRVYGDRAAARRFLEPLLQGNLRDHGVGSLSEIFDGEPPFKPRGCFAQAWSVAETLRVWAETNEK
jgi:glycogen debranching enzyme